MSSIVQDAGDFSNKNLSNFEHDFHQLSKPDQREYLFGREFRHDDKAASNGYAIVGYITSLLHARVV